MSKEMKLIMENWRQLKKETRKILKEQPIAGPGQEDIHGLGGEDFEGVDWETTDLCQIDSETRNRVINWVMTMDAEEDQDWDTVLRPAKMAVNRAMNTCPEVVEPVSNFATDASDDPVAGAPTLEEGRKQRDIAAFLRWKNSFFKISYI